MGPGAACNLPTSLVWPLAFLQRRMAPLFSFPMFVVLREHVDAPFDSVHRRQERRYAARFPQPFWTAGKEQGRASLLTLPSKAF